MRDIASRLVFATLIAFPLVSAAEVPGRALYVRYCGACHGPHAKGDGIVASLMRPPPPDLTTIAARSAGTFSIEEVARTIDGREMPHGHGEPTMPVWGTVLSERLGSRGKQRPAIERRVQSQIYDIAEYLRGIQGK